MADTNVITLGLSQIKVADADESGAALTTEKKTAMQKIGKTYKDTAQIAQDSSDVTEHYEEGHAAPEVRKKTKKVPTITFSLMNPDAQILADYVGGTNSNGTWSFDGTEKVKNKAIFIETEQGLDFYIPNADIEAVINGQFNASGIVLVEFTVTPCAVSTGKAIYAIKKEVASK